MYIVGGRDGTLYRSGPFFFACKDFLNRMRVVVVHPLVIE